MDAERVAASPVLHVTEHGAERTCTAPTRFMGRLVVCDETHVDVNEGRGRIIGIRIAELAPYLGGPEPAARILAEAAANQDFVAIAIHPSRITYDNDAQLERAERLLEAG